MEGPSVPPRRGRVASSRYMDATASSRAATVGVPAETKRTAGAPKKATKTSTSVQRLITNPTKRTHIKKSDAPSSALTAKHRTMTSDRSCGLGSSGRARVSNVKNSHTAEVTTYGLDIASQLYAWIFMRQALTESSNHAVAHFQTAVATRVRDLEAEGDALADYCLRIQTAWESQLLDDASRQQVYSVVPTLIQAFVFSQERCQAAMVNTIRIQEMYSEMACTVRSEIRNLDQLTGETTELYKSIVALSRTGPLDSLLAATLEGMLLVLDMRIENLELSRKVLTTVWDNEAFEIGEPS